MKIRINKTELLDFNQLKKALRENYLESRLKFLAKYKILIIDEIVHYIFLMFYLWRFKLIMDYTNIFKNIKEEGFFSEYLPPCFEADPKMFSVKQGKCNEIVVPYIFTMSRLNVDNIGARRNIYIPEFGGYYDLFEFLKNQNILKTLIEFANKSENSFSKILREDGTIFKHDDIYQNHALSKSNNNSDYITNISKKIIKSAGAKKVLKLDISECYASFYTHCIPAILMGKDKAENEYRKIKRKYKGIEKDNNYSIYTNLDKKIRNLNMQKTNGILTGPKISAIIVEALLTRLDIELNNELKNFNIAYVRFVDDYEVFLHEDNEKQVISIFTKILKRYGLNLNVQKTRIEEYPYYIVKNLDKIIDTYKNSSQEDIDIMSLFSCFMKLETTGTKGAVRYLLKKLSDIMLQSEDEKLIQSYLISIIANNDRALIRACSCLVQYDDIEESCIQKLKCILNQNLENGFDLEVIWILYVLLEKGCLEQNDNIVKSICEESNELAQIMLLRKNLISDENIIISKASSWILNYELYAQDLITDEEFKDRLIIDSKLQMYKEMKESNLHFCYKEVTESNK